VARGDGADCDVRIYFPFDCKDCVSDQRYLASPRMLRPVRLEWHVTPDTRVELWPTDLRNAPRTPQPHHKELEVIYGN
jgi:hypothetical protein